MSVLIKKYSESYIVKISIKRIRLTQCEGGGWHSHTGETKLSGNISRIKFTKSIPQVVDSYESLSSQEKELYDKVIEMYENSIKHKNLLKSNCKIKES